MPYAGVTTAARLPALTTARMLADLNGVLQNLFSGRQHENKSLVIRAPGTITIDNVTTYSTAITFAGFDASMLGCTVQITGDPRENRLVKSSGTLALENPYMGSTAAGVTATIHYDCATVDIGIGKIYEPMSLDRKWDVALVDRATIDKTRLGLDRRQIMRPIRAAIEDALDASGTPGRRIVFDTLPDQSYLLHFRAEIRAPVVTSFDDARTYLLPNGLDESVLKPLVLFAFSTFPDFTGDAGKVKEAAGIARAQWDSSSGPGLARREVSMRD